MRLATLALLAPCATALTPQQGAPRRVEVAAATASRSAAGAAALALGVLAAPLASFAADNSAVDATAQFLAEASKSKKVTKSERDTSSPFGLEEGVKTPFEKGASKPVAAEVAAAESLVAKKAGKLLGDISETTAEKIGDAAPTIEFKQAKGKRETPAYLSKEYEAPPAAPPAPEPEAAAPAEPAFTVVSKRDDPNLAATNAWLKEAAKSKAKPTPKKAPPPPAAEDPYAGLTASVSAKYD